MASKTMYEREKEITDKIGTKEAIEMFESLLLSENYKPVALNHCRRLAIAALKKQIPQKPINFYCPCCKGANIWDGDGDQSNYCGDCGQLLDWSGINE